MTHQPRLFWIALAAAAGSSCVEDMELGRLARELSPPSDTAFEGGVERPSDECVPLRCGGKPTACGDCEDNDGDGLIDAEDPDCYGACDDSETSLGGRARPCPTDACFFDPDCGRGNDSACAALVPNGCDCHGCCEVPGLRVTVALGSTDDSGSFTCNGSLLGDPSACQPCELDPACHNPCASCELCFGRVQLPEACAADTGCSTPSCPEGQDACGGCAGPCGSGEACVTGCCVVMLSIDE